MPQLSDSLKKQLIDWAVKYDDPVYFSVDPIAFPREFLSRGASLQDIEISAIFAAHFAWGGNDSKGLREAVRLYGVEALRVCDGRLLSR